jgi:hypothetical protein
MTLTHEVSFTSAIWGSNGARCGQFRLCDLAALSHWHRFSPSPLLRLVAPIGCDYMHALNALRAGPVEWPSSNRDLYGFG